MELYITTFSKVYNGMNIKKGSMARSFRGEIARVKLRIITALKMRFIKILHYSNISYFLSVLEHNINPIVVDCAWRGMKPIKKYTG